MKPVLPILFLMISSIVNAHPKAAIYCKDVHDGKMSIYDATSEEGHYQCSGHFLESAACYTGPRSEVIKLLNSGEFNWDEEWLANAHYRGTYSISYEFVDGPNDLKTKATIEHCTKNYFTNPAVGPFLVTYE